MQKLNVFNSEKFGQVRTIFIDNVPYFVGKDVAGALGYSKERNALSTHVGEDDKKVAPIQGLLGGTQEMVVINESGLYSLIFGSRLDSAKEFKHWVTSEVLPSLRKTGLYSVSTTHPYPVSPAAMASATNAGRLFERIMRREGLPPYEIAAVVRNIFQQAGIDIPEYVVKVPEYEQLSFNLMMGR